MFSLPDWFLALTKEGDWNGIHWYTLEQIRQAADIPLSPADFLMPREENPSSRDQTLLARMVPVAEGPPRTDRLLRVRKARLYLDRENPEQLLFALARNHPPSLWVPAGRTRETANAVLDTYFFPGLPAQETLPFQKRLFLTSLSMFGDDFEGIERWLARSAFCDSLLWGTSQLTDPYPERVIRGYFTPFEHRGYIAQTPDVLPRLSIRTRFSRSIIQAIDFHEGYLADLFFRPAPHPEVGTDYNTRYGTDFPPATPIDVIATLSGFLCLGADQIRGHAEAAEDSNQGQALQQILAFMEEPISA